MKLNTIFVLVVLSIFYFLVPLLVMFFVGNNKKLKIILSVLLSLFLVVLFIGVFGEIDITKEFVYIDFDFSAGFFNKDIITNFSTYKVDRVINLIMLIPIGEVVCISAKQKNSKFGILFAVIIGLLTGLFIETFQFILPVPRSVQLSDVVYNTISCVIGYLYISLFFYLKKLIIFLKYRSKYKSTKLDN